MTDVVLPRHDEVAVLPWLLARIPELPRVVDPVRAGAPFRWAYDGVDHLAWLARSAGMRVLDHSMEDGQWIANLH
jgi:hypothetical protein